MSFQQFKSVTKVAFTYYFFRKYVLREKMHIDSLETSMDEVWNIFIFQNQRNKKQLSMHDHVGKQKNASIKNISASSKYQVIIGLHTKRTHMFTGGINSLHTNVHYSNPIRTLPPQTWSRPNEETSLFVLNLPENQAANSSLNARSFGALFIGWLKKVVCHIDAVSRHVFL